jgi:hypothetical protein
MNPADDQEHRLLLDIDALYDSRFGTLLQLNGEAALQAVRNGYQIRELDDFETLTNGMVTNEEFQKAYAKRDLDTLKKSIVTGIPVVLISHIETLMERIERGVNVTRVTITLNTWPYILPGPVIEAMVEVLGVLIPPIVHINSRRINTQKLTPTEFKAMFNGWVTYDFDAWFRVHAEELLFRRANELTVILPRLHISAPGEYDIEDDESLNKLDKPSLHAMVLEEFIHLEHLPVVDFCFFTPGSYNSSSSSSSSPSLSESSSGSLT